MAQVSAGLSNNDESVALHSGYQDEHRMFSLDIDVQDDGGGHHDQQRLVVREGIDGEETGRAAAGGGVFSRRLWGLPLAWVLVISLVALLQVAVCVYAFRVYTQRSSRRNEASAWTPGGEVVSDNPGQTDIPSCLAVLRGNVTNYLSPRLGGRLNLTENEAGVLTCHHYPAFHFRPKGRWQNDPNGPLFYRGVYHLFFQYNPFDPFWKNIQWGHAVSPNLVDWLELPVALAPDQWYDEKGVFSGSATILDDGQPALLYTGVTSTGLQVQNIAQPANPLDPYLRKWVKSPANPLINAPPAVDPKNFRDPSTAWKGEDNNWWTVIGVVDPLFSDGGAQLFVSPDFFHWEAGAMLQSKAGTGMWECPDLFSLPVNEMDPKGEKKYVLKISLDRLKFDCYVVGTYSHTNQSWVSDETSLDIGLAALRYDYGKFYASKTFFDSNNNRTILWGWVGELSIENLNLVKGWASLQSLPRVVRLDDRFKSRLIQMPVPEVEAQRVASNTVSLTDVMLEPGSLIPVDGLLGSALDIEVVFGGLNVTSSSNGTGNASECCYRDPQVGKAVGGLFGLLVLADIELAELTSIYFDLPSYQGGEARNEGKSTICLCNDLTRSSLFSGIEKPVYGAPVPVLSTETSLALRVLVDRSIIETFGQGGRSVITSRVYPQLAVEKNAHVFFFNNGTIPVVVNSFKAWQMLPATIA